MFCSALSYKHALVHEHVNVWVIRNTMVIHWASAPESDWCLCSGLCNLVSKVLVNCHWCMPNLLHVLHDYSSCLHHLHMVRSPMMVITVAFNDYTMCPRTPVFHLDHYCRSWRKECRVFVNIIILSVCFSP